MTFAMICYTCSITCCSQVRCPQVGGKPYSKCCQKHWSLEQQRTSDQLRAFVSFKKPLHIWFWVELKVHWKQASRRNNLDSVQKDVLKNTYWLSTWSWTKPWRWTSHCGSSALIFHKPSTGTLASGGRSWRITTGGLDPPSLLLSATWGICWINGQQLRIWHCSWRATRACSQPTFVLFRPWMGTVQMAGTT